MDFLDKRIKGICDELKKLWVKQSQPLSIWEYKPGRFFTPTEAQENELPWETFSCDTMHWYGPDKHYWFKTSFTVPKEFHGKSLWIQVRSQIEEWDDAKNPQFLLFVNGEIVQGLDMNHREVLLTGSAGQGDAYDVQLQAHTGILHTEFRLISHLQEIDEDIKKLYYHLWVPLSSFTRMDEDDKIRRDLEMILNETVNLLDLRTPYSDAFYTSLNHAVCYIEKALYEEFAGYSEVIASCIGHTHIDVAWWWTVAQTREKVARSFATVLKMMEEYPNYKFMSSQPQLYQFLKERYPALYQKVKERIEEQRWEPEGGMWVEADCNLTSGESLVRQFLYGKRFFKEEFGVDNKILWLPDVFGYSGALPQIMKKCGIDYFMTTKLAWNQFNKIPYDTMRWRGIDGTEILTHLITTLGVHQPIRDFFTTYNGMLHPDAIMGGWERYQNKDINNDILVSYGYGDGGGGPTREMLETSLRMEKGIKGIPKVRQCFARDYFDRLCERVRDNKRLPVWEGEFYFEYHRGTYTSMARNKRANRKSELGLMNLELLSVLTADKLSYPGELLEQTWKTVLLNQFHDILPGSSIKEVYEVTKSEYKEIAKTIDDASRQRMKLLAPAAIGKCTLFNPTGFEREDVVFFDENMDANYLKASDGSVYPLQNTAEGAVAYVKHLPSKGYKVFDLCKGENNQSLPFTLTDDYTLETPFYSVKLHEDGTFARLIDKEHGREVFQEGSSANLLRMYEDKPIYYDNWDIDIYYTEKFWDVTQLEKLYWSDVGAVSATLNIERRESNSLFTQKIRFYAQSRRIDFETVVDWKEHQTLLKVHFPVNVHTDEATFDIQFGNLTRKTHQNTGWDKARFESCGQKWMDLSEGHYGVSMLNDCKYGHSVKDSNMALTLIKSGIEPNPTTDQEIHYFTYAIYPHAENWRMGGTVREAYQLNQPVMSMLGQASQGEYSYVSVSRENIILETVKQAEDDSDVILRLYECDNSLTDCVVTFAESFEQAWICNLLEERQQPVSMEGASLVLTVKPYEIVTLRLKKCGA